MRKVHYACHALAGHAPQTVKAHARWGQRYEDLFVTYGNPRVTREEQKEQMFVRTFVLCITSCCDKMRV
jgi:hypothetical protein